MSEKLVLIDGHSILNRAFFGLPDLTNSKGVHTNAVYGFLNIMFKILEEEQPDYLTVAFDLHAPTFRHDMYKEYKGTRKPMADELRQQVPLMKEMLTAMGVTIVEKAGYEADDLLGTLAHMAEEKGLQVSVISGDRDLLQLATQKVQIRIPKTKNSKTEIENYYAKDVEERYQVSPAGFIELKALMGDTADNIPGVPGIGEKTATALIVQYGSIESVYEHAAEVKPPRAANNIVEYWEQAVLSKTLATIITDVPLSYEWETARLGSVGELYTQEAYLLCKELEFKNLLNRFERSSTTKENDTENFIVLSELIQVESLNQKIEKKTISVCITEDMGASVALGENEIYYLPPELVNELDTSKASLILAFHLKNQLSILEPNGYVAPQERKRYIDVGVAAYLLNPLKGDYPYDDIAKDYLGILLPSKEEIFDKKKTPEPEEMVRFLCYHTYSAFCAYPLLLEQLQEKGMASLFFEIEMPLVFVLSDMEREGIGIDAKELKEYGTNLLVSIEQLEQTIYEQAGERFNINSPKQLGVILFEKMQLPNGKKTKTGYSTSAEVLEKLSEEYPFVKNILEYRQLTKLKSTYADGLANCIQQDGKIHTSFHQTITATGRLSSTEPNLQNIPIRIELGKLIRKVFHPMEGNVFIDADYSQIELRVLAHLSQDEQLIEAYKKNQDIHSSTASLVFHVPIEEVTPLLRRNAKAVNFGIVYGISAFGLSKDLDISKKEAQEYIDRYFMTYPKIKTFLDQSVEEAKQQGYSKTLFGRIRPIPELTSSNFMQRQFGERVAMNAPIQGTAADIIKIAMIQVHDRLMAENLQSKLILQVHDELLIEATKEEEEIVTQILIEEMGKATDMSVALDVEANSGGDWYAAH